MFILKSLLFPSSFPYMSTNVSCEFQTPCLMCRFLVAGSIIWKDYFAIRTKKQILQRKEFSMEDFCDPSGARTQDPNIKSVVLYQLS